MNMADDCVDSLLHGKELCDSDAESLKASLASKTVQTLQKIALEVSVQLLEVFVSMNAENGDVYSAKCSCVSG